MATETKTTVKKRPINRLQSMYALRAMIDQQYEDTRKAKDAGKPIVWCMVEAYAAPFLNAMDIESVYPEGYATQCATTGTAAPYLDRSEAEGFPNTLCSYAQNTVGYTVRMIHDLGGKIPPEAPRGGMPKPDFLIGSCGGTCDARYKWFQALGRYLDCPVWIMESPGTGGGFMGSGQREALIPGAYERNVQFVVNHLRDFVAFLEHLLGRKFDYDKFEEDVDNTIEMNAAWYGVTDELRKARPCPMNSRDHWSSYNAVHKRTTDPKGVKELIEKMGDEVKYRIENGISGINHPEKYRAMFQGLGPYHAMNIFDNLAERSWNFVHEGSGHYPAPIDLSWVKDPIEKLVRERMRNPEWMIDHDFEPEEAAEIKQEIMEKGFANRCDNNVVSARDYQIDGVILQTALTCRMTSCRTGLTQHHLMEVYKVPSLVFFGDQVDSRLFNMDDFMKKCEAFEETMDHYKKERKKIGLPW